MRRFIGPAVVVFGLVHLVYVMVTSAGPLRAIIRDGVVNAVAPHPEREAPFWSLLFGMYVTTTGALIARFQSAGQPPPAVSGWALLGMGLGGGILMPYSGFWVGIPLGLLILAPSRRRGMAPKA